MQTQAPIATVATVHRLLPPPSRLAQQPIDTMFRIADRPDCVLAVLAARGVGVRDGESIWCVVVARNAGAGVIGQLLALPADTVVEPVRLAAPMQIAVGA